MKTVPFRAQGMLAVAASLFLLAFVGVQSTFDWRKIQASVQDVVTPFEEEEASEEPVDSETWRSEEMAEQMAFLNQWLPVEPTETYDRAQMNSIRERIEMGETLTGEEWVNYNVAKAIRIKARHELESPSFVRRSFRTKNES